MKKCLAVVVTVLLVFAMVPASVLAADGTISTDGTHDLSEYGNGSTITVNSGLNVTLTNTGGATFTNLKIVCSSGVSLTIDSLLIDDSATSNVCALSFTGASNSLILKGENVIRSGANEPGIRVEAAYLTISGSGSVTAHGGTEGAGIGSGEADAVGKIVITSGTVNAYGHNGGAGIGGGSNADGGIIEISGGTVNAYGANEDFQVYRGGAGIGGGDGGNCGNITISGDAVVTATGGTYGAGIGNADGGDGGTIKISGGSITAIGGGTGAGIGGGCEGDSVTITIAGGTVISRGGTGGAGIGGGYFGDGGTIEISGGTIEEARGGDFAAGIGGGWNDDSGTITITGGTITLAQGGKKGAGIGSGSSGYGGLITIDGGSVTANGGAEGGAGIGSEHGGTTIINGGLVFASGGVDIGSESTLTISGDAGVFLENDIAPVADTTSHIHFDSAAIENGKIYGVEMPDGWTETAAYIIPCILTYDANGGIGTTPGSETLHKGGTIAAAAKGDLENGNLAMVQWNTEADGEGYGYYPGVDITINEDVTLYAIWRDMDVTSVTLDKNTLSMIHHDTAKLTATVDPADATKDDVVWYSNDTDVAVVDQNGNVTATGAGSTTIVAWADGVRDTCSVTVTKKPVTVVTLSSTAKTLTEGEKDWLTASVSPSDATDAEVTWTSSDTSVVTVSSGGFITANSEGSATITATADGVSGTCKVTVKAEENTDDTRDSDTIDTDTQENGEEELPDTGDGSEDEPQTVIVYIDVSSLPEGTESVRLPDGSVVEVGSRDSLQIEIDKDYIGEDGSFEIVALDSEGNPLSSYSIDAEAESSGSGMPGIVWLLIGIAGTAVIVIALYLLLIRKRLA